MSLSDGHLRAIGRVVVNFQNLELHIAFLASGLIGPEQAVGQMITAQLPFGKLCVLAESLFEHRFGMTAFAPRFSALVRRSLALEERRNQLLHSAWLTDDASAEVWRLKTSLKLGKGLQHVSPVVAPEEVNMLADELAEVAKGVLGLIPELYSLGLVKEPQ